MAALLEKLELDVMQANELEEAVNLAVKHRIPSIIVHPGLILDAVMLRSHSRGDFKIIAPVDWPRGETYGLPKFMGLNVDALDCDGFEFIVTPNRPESDIKNEMSMLTDFVRKHVSEVPEIRFVFNALTNEDTNNIKSMAKAVCAVKIPTLVRTDYKLKLQVSRANPEIQNNIISMIREITNVPLKISGNMNSIKAIMQCQDAAKFAVNLTQVKSIIKELQRQPEKLKEMLSLDESTEVDV
jgi:hypothetical protein